MKSELLLSLPPNMCASLPECDPALAARCFASFDPPGSQLGSGGGTAWLLDQAWRSSGVEDFSQWLNSSSKILIHSGGESRRLPAYAAAGKLFMPVPALRWKYGQRLDQTLLDLQEPFLRRVASQATGPRVMIASGDVLLEGETGPIPDADVVLLGMWTTPEQAAHFGVMFCDRNDPGRLMKFLQKPASSLTRELSREYLFLIDVGVWLLSERAVRCLMARCGRDETRQQFAGGLPETYDLYGEWALHLGAVPERNAADISSLSVAVVPVAGGEFYHFGRSADVIESAYALQNKVLDQTQLGAVPSLGQPRQFVLNSVFDARRSSANEQLWIENSFIPHSWELQRRHVLTGIPENDWGLRLAEGQCLDVVPLDGGEWAVRFYGFDDPFRGAPGAEETRWMGCPAAEWFLARDLSFEEAGVDAAGDLQTAPLFPVFGKKELDGSFLQWLLSESPERNPAFKERWLSSARRSARALGQQADLKALYAQRKTFCHRALPIMARHGASSLFYKLDISSTATEYAQAGLPLIPEEEINWGGDRILPIHDQMFRSSVLRLRGEEPASEACRRRAFDLLGNLFVEPLYAMPVVPVCSVLEDQIVWARSPARIDLAGGWSDTPPYCLEHGGSVFNMAVNLNGQPPIQVFVRFLREPELVIRSIDLGLKEELKTYEDVGCWRGLNSGFSIARAAFALAGFHPDFNGGQFASLKDQLNAFGGGLEVSLLAALPKGSGMGTSSILAGTLLGGLSDFCSLGWDCIEIARRVSALEQMLGSGGGWQDQYGGLLRGAKLIETKPGLSQDAVVRWTPGDFFDEAMQDGRMLLYYTGITRVAHNVLGEIVRNLFLNHAGVLERITAIAENGHRAFAAVQRYDWDGFVEVIRRSWALNQELDVGTNPPEVQAVLRKIEGEYAALKLAGAGGGGYLLILVEDRAASQRIRQILSDNPPGPRARFVDLQLSSTGLQVSRS
jgi:galactokinase/mevalonate kinase-like predicted kinase